MNKSNRVVVMFPYGGLSKQPERAELFFRMLETALNITECEVIVVINQDTVVSDSHSMQLFEHMIADKKLESSLDVKRVWSVDTCQMWLYGWGHVLDKYPQTKRIIQLPGDLSALRQPDSFFGPKLQHFINASNGELIVGDFTTGERHSAKDLIDIYGTFPLMQNWFPEAAKVIWRSGINHPRSEFLNIDVNTLRGLLNNRKFAYEQTLNMLIQLWYESPDEVSWNNRVNEFDLGELRDDPGFRKYRDCLDQIERMERMLKLLWRERWWQRDDPSEETISEFEMLDKRSTAIRDNAKIIIKGMLEI